MAVLTAVEIYNVALTAGFTPDQAITWTAIALAESNGVTDLSTAGGVGLWQLDVDTAGRFGNLDDPLVSAKAAFALSQQGRDLTMWADEKAGTTKDFHTFIPAVTVLTQQAAGPVRTGAGYDQIDQGNALSQFATPADTDGDGLTDEFEALLGTDPNSGDSDADGLTDTFEVLTTHTDPLLADTDADGRSDALEYTTGTPAGTATNAAVTSSSAGGVDVVLPDADGDGLSDARENQLGLNANAADTDGDGMSDSLELSLGTDAKQVDTDHDGMSDWAETQYGLDPTVANVAAPTATLTAAPTVAVPTTPAMTATGGQDAGKVQHMLDAAMGQLGDQYVYGVDTDPNDPDPTQFDCAELTQWAGHQVGVDLEGASYLQFLQLKAQGLLIPVDQAEHTPGALLFHFSSEPIEGGGRPSSAHVALSLGNGKTIEAASTKEGVVSKNAGERFNYAAVLPGMNDGETWNPDLHTWSPTDAPWPNGIDPAGGGSGTGTEMGAAYAATTMSASTTVDPTAAAPTSTAAPTSASMAPPAPTDRYTVDSVMAGIREQESGGDYKAENPTSTASGAYQYIDGTWDDYGGYNHAADAPPEVQDEKMRADVEAAYRHFGDWERVIAAHFAGEDGQKGDKSTWDYHPGTAANQNPTVRDYVDSVEKHIAELDPTVAAPTPAPTPVPAPAAATTDPVAHGVGSDSIDLGAAMTGGGVDSDHDGLTDEFEKLLGLDPTNADTDHDGLNDGYEVMSSHTDALIVDSDHDGLSDGMEISLGTNPTLLDSDYDGITDLAEMHYGNGTLGSGLPTAPDDATLPGGSDVDLLVDGGGLH